MTLPRAGARRGSDWDGGLGDIQAAVTAGSAPLSGRAATAAPAPGSRCRGCQSEAAGSESRVRVRLRRCDYPQPLSVAALGLHRDRGPSPSESGLNRDLKFDWAVTIQRTQIQAESDLLPLAAPGRASLSSQ